MIDVKKPLELFNPNRAAHKVTADCSLIAVSPSGLIVVEHNLNGIVGGVGIFTSDGQPYKSCPAWTLRNKAPEPRSKDVYLSLIGYSDGVTSVITTYDRPYPHMLNMLNVIGTTKVTVKEGDTI